MQKNNFQNLDILTHNQNAWDKQAKEVREWSKPVSHDLIAQAKRGQWEVHLTPSPVDKTWLGDVKGKRILCLASAGGQQAPILAAAGAVVTVFDLSTEQLKQDERVAERDELDLITIQGNMLDLRVFSDESFDMVFHPISNHYISDVCRVWDESYRVLRKQGVLLASFFNPIVFVADRDPSDIENGIIRPRFTLPYSDLNDLTQVEIEAKLAKGEALVFGHTLENLLGGQMKAGFAMTDFVEEMQPNSRFLIDKYVPTFIATRSIKM